MRVKTVLDCFDDLHQQPCPATVGEMEDCMEQIAGDPWRWIEQFPEECSPLLVREQGS